MGTQLCRSFSSQSSSHPKQFKIKMRPTYILDDDSPIIDFFVTVFLFICLFDLFAFLPKFLFFCQQSPSLAVTSFLFNLLLVCRAHISIFFLVYSVCFFLFLPTLSFSCYQQSRLHRNGGYQWRHWEAQDKLQKTKYKSLLHLSTNTIWKINFIGWILGNPSDCFMRCKITS